jgi:Pectate lyase superfamily protein
MQTIWFSPTEYVTGDPSLGISYPFASHSGTVVTCAAPGDLKWISMGLRVPPNVTIDEVIVCYQVSNPRSYISQVRLVEMTTPDLATVFHDDPTPLNSTSPTSYNSRVTGITPVNAVLLELRLNFKNTTDAIRLGAIGVTIQPAVVVPSYPKLQLPTAGIAGSLARVSDDVLGLWMDAGSIVYGDGAGDRKQWFSLAGEVVNVKEFGAKGDGITPDTAALRSALNAAGTWSGGMVFLPAGTYLITDYLNIPSNVHVRGAGRNATRIVLTVSNNAYGFSVVAGVQHIGISGLTVAARATGATTQTTLINMVGTSGAPIDDVVLDDLLLDGATFCGLFTSYVRHLQIGKLFINNALSASFGSNEYVGGVGIWLFKGTQYFTAQGLFVDGVDDTGVYFDCGTNSGGSDFVGDGAIGQIIVNNVGRVAAFGNPITGAGVGLKGASRMTVGEIIVRGASTTHIFFGVDVTQNQNGNIPQDNVFSSVICENIGGPGISFRGAQRCTVHAARLHNPTMGARAGNATGYAVYFTEPSRVLNNVCAADTADNTIGFLDVLVDSDIAKYDYGVLFEGAALTWPDGKTKTISNCRRNRVLSARWGSGTPGTFSPGTALYNSYAADGADAPMAGCNANTLSCGTDTDHLTMLHQGSRIKNAVPGVGTMISGPGRGYAHFESDLPFYFDAIGGGPNQFYVNGLINALSGIKWGLATVADDPNGSVITLGHTTQGGPASATAVGWLPVTLSDGTMGYLPIWK